MSTTVWVAISGSVMILGILLLLARLLPAHVDLADALGRFTPPRHPVRAPAVGPDRTVGGLDGSHRLGLWAARTLPPAVWARTPARDLGLLQVPLARFYGDKVRNALLGAVIPTVLVSPLVVLGVGVPVAVPVVGGLLVAGLMFFLPDYNVADEAKKARVEARRALTAYIDLVTLERSAGSMAGEAMKNAAALGRSWIFVRIAQELDQTQWSGIPPWTALKALADDLGLPDLHDVADILEMTGTESSAAIETLQERSKALREAILTDDIGAANAASERMTIPGALLAAVFAALLGAPALLGILAST